MSASQFERTTEGKIARYRFLDMPVVWLEGETDYPMYEPILSEMGCEIGWADGKQECRKLVEAMMAGDLPYVVVLDGDYEILRRCRSWHRRAVLLQRHSIENYCAEVGVVQSVCRKYSRGRVVVGDVGVRFGNLLEALESELGDLVVLDVALGKTGGQDGRGVMAGERTEGLEAGVTGG